MPTIFPGAGQVQVPAALAGELLRAAERLPDYDNKEYYSLDLQASVHERIHRACPEGFSRLIEQIRARIARRPYCALVQGLRFDAGNRLFVALNKAFGDLVARPYEKPRAQLVHYIQPATDLPSARGGHYETEKFHTDTADWETPVELISMQCVRADHGGGGRSLVLDIDTLRAAVKQRLGTKTLALMERAPVPWKLPDYCGGGLVWRPVLTASSVCWRRYSIDFSQRDINTELPAALDAFERVITSTPPRTLNFAMRENELLFINNHRTLHARTPVSSKGGRDRLMIRSWIRTDKKPPRTPGYKLESREQALTAPSLTE